MTQSNDRCVDTGTPLASRHGAQYSLGREGELGTAPGRWVLVATILGSSLAGIDGTVVGIALPTIGRDLHASFAGLQWTVSAYTLTLASLILWGGAVGDRVGRRRMFVWGVVAFTVASALCAAAPGLQTLILARALQGVGGALLTPASLAIIESDFAVEDRARAVGTWAGFSGVATAAAPSWVAGSSRWRAGAGCSSSTSRWRWSSSPWRCGTSPTPGPRSSPGAGPAPRTGREQC